MTRLRKRMCKRITALALALTLCFGLSATALAAEPFLSKNRNAQNYQIRSSTVKSALYENGTGWLTRVEYVDGKVVIEDYGEGLRLVSQRTIEPELPIWGGFFAGSAYNFLIFGQKNDSEDDGCEVIRVVKYDKAWNRLGAASLYGANTVEPFTAGSLRCAEYGDWLCVHTTHSMYRDFGGNAHQSNITLLIRQSDMSITDTFWNPSSVYGYVSHSFNQFVLTDGQGRVVTLDQGDGYPRALTLMRYLEPVGNGVLTGGRFVSLNWASLEKVDLLAYPGGKGENSTGCSVGGLAETSQGYVAAYNYNGTGAENSQAQAGNRDLYLAFVGKDMQGANTVRITTGANVSTPQIVSTGPDGGYILWNDLNADNLRGTTTTYRGWWDTAQKKFIETVTVNDPVFTLHYAKYNADGSVGEVKTAEMSVPLSDCKPIVWGGKVVWYVTNKYTESERHEEAIGKVGKPVFYLLDDSGIQKIEASGN